MKELITIYKTNIKGIKVRARRPWAYGRRAIAGPKTPLFCVTDARVRALHLHAAQMAMQLRDITITKDMMKGADNKWVEVK
jgi:hypothetical protein